jgi:siroheme synthase-like protein
MSSASYPIHLDLTGRRALVVGAGRVATRKIERLVETAANVSVVAAASSAPVRRLAEQGKLALMQRAVQESDVLGCFLVIAATDQRAVNAAVGGWARACGALVALVDDPSGSDFTVPAVVRGSHVEATVSSYGRAPSASRRLAHELRRWALGAPDRFTGEVAAVRRALDGRADASERLRRLDEGGLYEACVAGDDAAVRMLIEAALGERT